MTALEEYLGLLNLLLMARKRGENDDDILVKMDSVWLRLSPEEAKKADVFLSGEARK